MKNMRKEENEGNIEEGLMKKIERRYEGKRIGRKEMEGEMVEERKGEIW